MKNEQVRMKNVLSFLLFVAFSCSLAFAQQPAIALKGGKLLTITHGVIPDGVLVIENGKIAAVGPAASTRIPANAKVVDVTGMTVYPGLIDSETNLGLVEIPAVQATVDVVEPSDEIMPQMHVYDAFHAETAAIPVTRLNGITNAIVAPGTRDTLPGQDSFIQLYGRDAQEMLTVRDIAMPLNFTGDQRRGGGPDASGRVFPTTRMGMAAQLRQAFLDAQEYQRKLNGPKGNEVKRDLKLEALLPYLAGKKTVVVSADEPDDVLTAIGLAKEFNLHFVLDHLVHSESVLDTVAAQHVPVIVGPIYEQPQDDRRYDQVYRLPAELVKRGVKIAFASYDTHNARNLPYAAGFAVGYGLPWEEAMKALTINPAEIWGVADRLGSLDVGKDANVVVANGDPLDVRTDVKRVFIAGHEVPMRSFQTELRDEYSQKQ
ncbi:MAG: amidohydrolase family protein [Terriglobales bacterium]